MTRRHRPALGIVELAVDPADVDQETYPVRIRLTRPLTAYEAEGLASVEPGIRSEGDAIVLPAARLDDTPTAKRQAVGAGSSLKPKSLADSMEDINLDGDSGHIDFASPPPLIVKPTKRVPSEDDEQDVEVSDMGVTVPQPDGSEM